MAKQEGKGSFTANISEDILSAALESVEKHSKKSDTPTATPAAAVSAPPPPPKEPVGNDHQELHERFLRVSADFDNFRKRYQREKMDWNRYGAESFLHHFLPVIDNLNRALSATVTDGSPSSSNAVLDGLKLVQNQMLQILREQGVQVIDPLGESFDPLFHEAVETKIQKEHPAGTVIEVHQKGFKLWDRLLRPALVTVAMQEIKEN